MADATRDLRDAVSEKVRLALADVGSGILTAATAGRAPFADGIWTNTQLSNAAKAETICIYDSAGVVPTARVNNTRLWTNNADQSLTVIGVDLITGEASSQNSGSNLFLSLDVGTTVLASKNSLSLAAGTTTALTLTSDVTVGTGAHIRARQPALSVGGFARYTKILLHVRHSG